MAQPMPTQQEFRYQTVQLDKTQTLGVGSYGAVCKARCDELPCAAKILHPVMFQFNDPGAMAFLRKFEQECQFLRTINHPNIVQYLATSRDRETGLPVLLMELMDESLTSFLERFQQPLPYHTQLNLCYDIALAVAYLHSNEIIHRDLSSNNVLLIAGSRAKVTDFGMSKLIDTNPRMTPLTKCPGTLVYMSPEALKDPPVYSKKLDCFSEGVLTIQIITRQFPNPGPAAQTINDPRFPLGRVQVLVPETERRRSHIDLIDPAHPLLPITLRCLEFNEEDRPPAQELCHSLATLKEAPTYAQSVQQAQERGTRADTEGRERQIRELEQQLQDSTSQMQEKDQQLQEKDQQLQEKDRQLQDTILQLQANHATTAEKEREIHQLRQHLQEKDHVITVRERQLRELNHQLKANEQVTAEFQQNLLQKERVVRDLEERLSEKEGLVQQLQQKMRISDESSKRQEASSETRKNTELKWKQFEIHHSISYFQPAVDDKTVYFISTGEVLVLAYSSITEIWFKLPKCSLRYFSLAVVKGLLTTIGGDDSNGQTTNKLLSFILEGSERKWVEHFPPMPTKRFAATALCTGRHLIVAGGVLGTNETNKVEVMNTDSLQWTTASSLPYPVNQATATLCGDDVYLLGGFYSNDIDSNLVVRCSLDTLLQSCQNSKLPKALQTRRVWQRVADLPVALSACATLQGRLLAIGGQESSGKATTTVHEYNPVDNSWNIVSHTPTPCSWCAVAILPGNRIMAAQDETVQIGTLQ